MEVDYTEKLNFSDDEENQASKDKRDWWVELPYLIQYSFVEFMSVFKVQLCFVSELLL